MIGGIRSLSRDNLDGRGQVARAALGSPPGLFAVGRKYTTLLTRDRDGTTSRRSMRMQEQVLLPKPAEKIMLNVITCP